MESNLVDIADHKRKLAGEQVSTLAEREFERLEAEGKVERYTDANGETHWRKTAGWTASKPEKTE